MKLRDMALRLLVLSGLVLGGLAFAGTASAVDYVCNCLSGADSDCVPGSDSNPGTSPSAPLRTYDEARSRWSSRPAGSQTRFCAGGSFTNTRDPRWDNRNCANGDRCVISDYTPPWASGDEQRPILTAGDNLRGFAFAHGGDARHTGNVLLENMDLRGSGQQAGVFMHNDQNDIELRNLRIENFAWGVHIANSNSCVAGDSRCNGKNDRIFLHDLTILNNSHQGVLGSIRDGGIFNSYFEGNGRSNILDHNIYLVSSNGSVVANNRLYKSSVGRAEGGDDICRGTSLVMHGDTDGIIVENNEIWEDLGAAKPTCWGIALDNGYSKPERFENVLIRGNLVRNVGSVAIGVGACQDCTIDSNVVIFEQSEYGATAIVAPDRPPDEGDAETTRITVRNNSIYYAPGTTGLGINVGSTGTGHTIANNAIHYAGSNSNGFDCMALNSNTSRYVAVERNVCYHPNAPGVEWVRGLGRLSDWQARGLGQNSVNADPGFKNPAAGDLSAASSNSLIVDGAVSSLSPSTAFMGAARPGTPDIGAHEFGQSPPASPTPPAAPIPAPFLLE